MSGSKEPINFSFTEEENALDYLVEARGFLQRAIAKPIAWKWVVIALHGALYGFAVCACRGTTNDRVAPVNKKGHERLISISDALDMCQDVKIMGNQIVGKALLMSDDEKEHVRKLSQTFRNRFEHHVPGSWTFFDDDFRPMCRDVIEVIYRLARETGHVSLWRGDQSEQFDKLILECRELISR